MTKALGGLGEGRVLACSIWCCLAFVSDMWRYPRCPLARYIKDPCSETALSITMIGLLVILSGHASRYSPYRIVRLHCDTGRPSNNRIRRSRAPAARRISPRSGGRTCSRRRRRPIDGRPAAAIRPSSSLSSIRTRGRTTATRTSAIGGVARTLLLPCTMSRSVC